MLFCCGQAFYILKVIMFLFGFLGGLVVKSPPAMQETCKRCGFDPRIKKIPGSRRSPGKGSGNSLQNSSLENPMDRGAWHRWGHKEFDTSEWLNNSNNKSLLSFGTRQKSRCKRDLVYMEKTAIRNKV